MIRQSKQTLSRAMRSHSNRATFLRFACVGGAISVIDIGVLYGLIGLGTDVYLARLVSLLCAMTAGYFLNRYFTFHYRQEARPLVEELARFYSVHAIGGLLNYAVFSLIMAAAAGSDHSLGFLLPALGVWIGGTVGMCFNFLVSRKLVFDT